MATQLVTYFVTSPNLHTQAPNRAGEIYSVLVDQVLSPKLSTIPRLESGPTLWAPKEGTVKKLATILKSRPVHWVGDGFPVQSMISPQDSLVNRSRQVSSAFPSKEKTRSFTEE